MFSPKCTRSSAEVPENLKSQVIMEELKRPKTHKS